MSFLAATGSNWSPVTVSSALTTLPSSSAAGSEAPYEVKNMWGSHLSTKYLPSTQIFLRDPRHKRIFLNRARSSRYYSSWREINNMPEAFPRFLGSCHVLMIQLVWHCHPGIFPFATHISKHGELARLLGSTALPQIRGAFNGPRVRFMKVT